MAAPQGKTFDLDTLDYIDTPKKEEPTPAVVEKKEEPVVEDEPEKPAAAVEITDPPLEEEEEEEEELTEEEKLAAEKKVEEEEPVVEEIAADEFIAQKYSESYGLNSEEELDDVLETYAGLEEKMVALEKENAELKAGSDKPKFTSPQEEKAFEFLKNYDITRMGEGMQTLARVVTMDVNTAEPRILLEEKFVIEHPELTREESLKKFNRDHNRKYAIKRDDFEDDAAYQEEVDALKIDEKLEVAKAKEFLVGKQKDLKSKPKESEVEKNEVPPVVTTSIAKNVAVLDDFMPKFTGIVYSPNEEDDQFDFSINFSKEQLKSIHEATKGWISNPKSYDAKGNIQDETGFDPDAKIKQVAYLMFGDDIAEKIYKHAMNQADIKRAEQIAKVKPTREAKTAVSKVTGVSEEKQQEMIIRQKQAERAKKKQMY